MEIATENSTFKCVYKLQLFDPDKQLYISRVIFGGHYHLVGVFRETPDAPWVISLCLQLKLG